MAELQKCTEFVAFNSIISVLKYVDGHLPLEIGQITELLNINIRNSDLSAGSVPESIGLCTKLARVVLNECKIEGELPVGLRELKNSLGMSIYQ
jgi:hypothetical protein